MSRVQPRDPPFIILGVLAGIVLSALAGLVGLYIFAAVALWRFDYAAFDPSRETAAAVDQAFIDLSTLRQPRCTPEHLAAMREIVFKTPVINDAAFRLSDHDLCSSGLGIIHPPIDSIGPPDFVAEDGTEVWRARTLPYAPGLQTTIISRGRYSLLVRPAFHPSQTPRGASLSAVLINHVSGKVLPIQGPPVLYPLSEIRDGQRLIDRFRLVSIGCIAQGQLCYVQTVEPGDVLARQGLSYALLLLLGGSLGGVGGIAWKRLLGRRRALPNRMRAGIAREEFFVVYQPIIELTSGRVVGAEALLRWKLPDGVLVEPSIFIPAAESSALITELDCLVARAIVSQIGELIKNRPDFVVSFNISARDLADTRLSDLLSEVVPAAGIRPGNLALELTERHPITQDVLAALGCLQKAGYRIYLDDFGTGYSNINCIEDFHFDAVKLDSRFTQGLGIDQLRTRLTRTMLEMASLLELTIVAEGIETKRQEAYLRESGITLAQGWLYSAAIGAADLISLVGRHGGETQVPDMESSAPLTSAPVPMARTQPVVT